MRATASGLLIAVTLAVIAAAPSSERTPEEWLREANAAVARGDFDAAEKLYMLAEDRTQDPGLVAFNKGYAHFRRREFDRAEQHYTRALDDRDCPPERRANALYNRGVCLLSQGGLAKLRAAIDSFERCLAMDPAEPRLVGDARHNLELAKLMWAEARAKERKKPLPNEPTDDEPPTPQPTRPEVPQYDPFAPENLGTESGRRYGGAESLGPQAKGGTPKGTDQTTGGKGNQPVLANADRLPDWNDQQVREYLDHLAGRLARERRGTAVLTAPAERPNVKDW